MNRFNMKKPKGEKAVLVIGLLVALGFNLSWNPSATQIARHETGMSFTEMASHDDQKSSKTTFLLGDVLNNSNTDDYKDVKIIADVNASSGIVSYTTEGSSCDTCFNTKEMSIDVNDLKQLVDLKSNLAKAALKELMAMQKRDSHIARHKQDQDSDDTDSPKRKGDVTSSCDQKLVDGGLISCIEGEYEERASNCSQESDKKKKKVCRAQISAYANKFLIPAMQTGLASSDPDILKEATDARRALMKSLPDKAKSMRAALIVWTKNGVLARANNVYQLTLQSSIPGQSSAGMAAAMAQDVVTRELNAADKTSTYSQMLGDLAATSPEDDDGSSRITSQFAPPMMNGMLQRPIYLPNGVVLQRTQDQTFNAAFYDPLLNFFQMDKSAGIPGWGTNNNSQAQTGFGGTTGSGLFAPNVQALVPGMLNGGQNLQTNAPNGAFQNRIDGSRGSVPILPGAFGTPSNGGPLGSNMQQNNLNRSNGLGMQQTQPCNQMGGLQQGPLNNIQQQQQFQNCQQNGMQNNQNNMNQAAAMPTTMNVDTNDLTE